MAAHTAGRLAHTLGLGLHLAERRREEREDAVGLPQPALAQDDRLRLVEPGVEGHQPSISCRPSSARARVTSSAYSRSPPTGSPRARRVTLRPSGRRSRVGYIAVASPSRLGLVARIISRTSSERRRFSRSAIFRSSGPIPSIGEIAPCSTW